MPRSLREGSKTFGFYYLSLLWLLSRAANCSACRALGTSTREEGEKDQTVVEEQSPGSDDPNDGSSVEFAEDVGLAFNSQDNVRWPEGFGRSDGGTSPYIPAKDTWHCIELFFDGAAQVQKLYVEGVEQSNATGFPDAAMEFSVFKFGYNALHGTERQIWYDDLAVAATRVGCL